jgi:hypothetical protein
VLESPQLKEAQAQITRLRDPLRKAQEKSEQFELETVELRQKVGELTLLIHRLRLDNVKLRDDEKRGNIQFDNIKQTMDIASRRLPPGTTRSCT